MAPNPKLYFILAIHNHQPVGNFDYVFEDAYKKAYLPFLELLQKHPSLKVVLHYSGNLLSWMAEKHPEAIDILKGFAEAKRVEFLTGGFYEPILSVLPPKDRVMQVTELTDYIQAVFNCRPKGMWLAERVWEPHMPAYLAEAGIEYLPVDDYHFKLSGLDDEALTGYYITEEGGSQIKIFPGSEKLRYLIPFRDVDETIAYFRAMASGIENHLLTMADDGEKFGVWPETHKHCYENGWLGRFFKALEDNAEWIETTTFSEYQSRFYPKGRVYLPTASYREMGEWALPPDKAHEYEAILNEMEERYGDKAKGLLRGGIWRYFLAKYPESNHLHKRMLMISRKVHEASEKIKGQGSRVKSLKKTPESMLHELWKGQCNDAYWHGIFGGLYLPHLRSSLYRHLINAESMAEETLTTTFAGARDTKAWKNEGDLDNDGFNDACVSTGTLTAFFSGQGGSLIELSLKEKSVNILDTLTRRPEAYHAKLTGAAHTGSGGTKTIHERLIVKEAGLSDYLIYDNYRRASLLDRFFDKDVGLDDFSKNYYEERGDFIYGVYGINASKKGRAVQARLVRQGTASGSEMKVAKTVTFKDSDISIDYALQGNYSGAFAIEWNMSFLGSPYTRMDVNGRRLFLKDKASHEGINAFFINDEFLKLNILFSFDKEIDLWHYPVETVSLSEEGVERIYQGTAMLFVRRLDLNGHKRLGFNIKISGG